MNAQAVEYTDQELCGYVKTGLKPPEIARITGLSVKALKQRLIDSSTPARMGHKGALAKHTTPEEFWGIKEPLQRIFNDLEDLADQGGVDPVKLQAEKRKTLETALKLMEVLASAQAQREFEDAVMTVLGEADEGLRIRIVQKLRTYRQVRQAFITR